MPGASPKDIYRYMPDDGALAANALENALLNDGRSLQIWEQACGAGVKEACLLAKSRPFQYEIFEWTFNLRRLCFRGDADGCRRLEEYVARTELKPKP